MLQNELYVKANIQIINQSQYRKSKLINATIKIYFCLFYS